MEKLTVKMILEIEPKLQSVIDFVKHPRQKEREWDVIWTDCKVDTDLQKLVGWFAENEKLRTMNAYDLFTDYLLDIIYENSKDENEEDE